VEAIERSKQTTLRRFIYALGSPRSARPPEGPADHFRAMKPLMDATISRSRWSRTSPEMGKAIHGYFEDADNRAMVEALWRRA